MSKAPLNVYKFKGIKLKDWGQGKFSIEKQYFKKEGDGGNWVETKSYFKNELEELRNLIDQALSTEVHAPLSQGQEGGPLPPLAYKDDPVPFDDSDDIPF